MKLPLLVAFFVFFNTVDCLDFPDGLEDESQLLEKTHAIPSEFQESHLEQLQEETHFDDGESVAERRACTPTISCELAGGYCIRRDEECDGTVDRRGCRGGRRCQCCIPDVLPTTCPTSKPCPVIETVKYPILDWNFVDEDHFATFNERMTGDDSFEFCRNLGLELYQPKNMTKVAHYLAEKFRSNAINDYTLGARGNGTEVVWISGEVVSRDEPWYGGHYGPVAVGYCMYLTTTPSFINRGEFLRMTSCENVNSDLYYPLCGEANSYTLTWHSVGEDTFARYNRLMDWDDSSALCNSFGLELYQPWNAVDVSIYLSGISNVKFQNYWIGAKGNGTDIVWLSGEVLPSNSSLWMFPPVMTQCVVLSGNKQNGDRGVVIRTWLCDGERSKTYFPLCG